MTLDDTASDDVQLEISDARELRRLHPLTPFLRSWRLIGGTAAVALGAFRDDLDRLKWIWHALHGDVEVGLLAKAIGIFLVIAIACVAGAWLSWRATAFAIVDDTHGRSTLLFHRGIFVKQRSQVRLNRVQSVDVNQPLIPRLVGMAVVQLDMAAGEGASVSLAYLHSGDAWALRDEILRHTGRLPAEHSGAQQPRDAEGSQTARSDDHDQLVAAISVPHLIRANLLDGLLAWILAFLWLVTLVVCGVVWGVDALVAALSGIIPVTLTVIAATRRQVKSILHDANFRLTRSDDSIRISSGLTSTTNRTINLDRIQGIRLVEPYLWRQLGWARVVVDIAGGVGKGEEDISLMPVADRAAAVALIQEVTGVDFDAPSYVGAGPQARKLDPLGWAYLGVALVEQGAIRRTGRWRRSMSYVPFARVQSVTANQGWLQRRLDLATVHLDVPPGGDRWTARHRGHADAAILVDELGRQARRHRLLESQQQQPSSSEPA